jgi:hypothetical protein
MKHLQAALGAMLLIGPVAAAHAAPVRVADFGFRLQDSDTPTSAEIDRLKLLDGVLRKDLAQRGYQLVSTAPLDAQIKQQDMLDCQTCASDFAQKLGAQISVIGWVQKVSNLILNVDLVLRDAKTNAMVRAGSVSIRSDTDESWERGLKYLLTESIFPKGKALPR